MVPIRAVILHAYRPEWPRTACSCRCGPRGSGCSWGFSPHHMTGLNAHPATVLQVVTRVNDDGLAFLKTLQNLNMETGVPAHGDPTPSGRAHATEWAAPRPPPTARTWRSRDSRPPYASDLWATLEVGDHSDALLLDAEGGHLREALWLDASNPAEERIASASARCRGSRGAARCGSSTHSTSPADTVSPSSTVTRRRYPETGAVISYRSATRVRASSSTTTDSGPRSTTATSTDSASGQNP
jgi:hypothetical protein